MDGFWSSFSKWFSEKTSSSLYFTYIGFFITWNWKFFQIVFLEKETLFSSPRVEYIASKLLFITPHYFGSHLWVENVINWVLNLSWHMIPPAIFTYLAIVYLPRVHTWALEKDLDNRFERKRMFKTKQRVYDQWLLEQGKAHEGTLRELVEVTHRQAESEKKIRSALTDEERWRLEYKEFEKVPSFYKFIC